MTLTAYSKTFNIYKEAMPIYELLVSIKETKDKAYCIIFILTFFNRNKKRQIKKMRIKNMTKMKNRMTKNKIIPKRIQTNP